MIDRSNSSDAAGSIARHWWAWWCAGAPACSEPGCAIRRRWPKLRTEPAVPLRQDERINRHVLRFSVDNQLEPVGEERPDQREHLGRGSRWATRKICRRFGLNIKPIDVDPLRAARGPLRRTSDGYSVHVCDQRSECHGCRAEPAARLKNHGERQRFTTFDRLDGRDLKGGTRWGLLQPAHRRCY